MLRNAGSSSKMRMAFSSPPWSRGVTKNPPSASSSGNGLASVAMTGVPHAAASRPPRTGRPVERSYLPASDAVAARAAVVVPARTAGLEHDDEVVRGVRVVDEELVLAVVAAHDAGRLDLDPAVVDIARRVENLLGVVDRISSTTTDDSGDEPGVTKHGRKSTPAAWSGQ